MRPTVLLHVVYYFVANQKYLTYYPASICYFSSGAYLGMNNVIKCKKAHDFSNRQHVPDDFFDALIILSLFHLNKLVRGKKRIYILHFICNKYISVLSYQTRTNIEKINAKIITLITHSMILTKPGKRKRA